MIRMIDVLHSPWCFIEAPDEEYARMLADKYDVAVREFNLWDVDDEELPGLPEPLSCHN